MKLLQSERIKRLNQIAIRQMQVLTSGDDPNFFSTSGKGRDFKSSFASGAGVFAFISIYTMIRYGNCIFWTQRNEWGEYPIKFKPVKFRGTGGPPQGVETNPSQNAFHFGGVF